MFELDHELAQKIVDRALTILPCNVNVMDSQGFILGSGEADRINTLHEGAQLVLANRRVVEIDDNSALSLKGVQPGINVPLMHEERLIGVLGLTGDPQALRTCAELLRMTAEMLVSQRHGEGEHNRRERRSDDLLALLLSNTGDSQRLLEEVEQLGLKPRLTRTPVLIELSSKSDLTGVRAWLSARIADSWFICRSACTLLWCYPSQSMVDPSKLLQKIEKQGWPILRMAVGIPAPGIDPLRNVCSRVTALAGYAKAVKRDQQYLLLTSYRLLTMLWTHREDDAVEELLATIGKVQSKDSNGQLIETLRSWCEHSGQIQNCADALGVHRSSLRYRMDRIAEITNKDLNKLEDVIELYFGIELLSHFVT